MKILIIGYSVRHIACSAARAGHDVIAADLFCDLDLERCASRCIKIDQPENQAEAGELVGSLIKRYPADCVVLGPGMEEVSVAGARLLNNPREKAAQVSDKLWLSGWLESRGFPSIPTLPLSEVSTLRCSKACPLVVKPRKGAGGVGIELLESLAGTDAFDKSGDDLIVQRWMRGLPASVSVISDGKESVAISVNEQLIGEAFAGARGFRYCGNITPLMPDVSGLSSIAEEIVSELGLVGSNGVDLLLTGEGPVVVEVNPRFQGSLDAVELSTGLNVFSAHLSSFQGYLPERPLAKIAAGRAVIFAEKEITVQNLLKEPWITDIPRPGSVIKKDDPVASILVRGLCRDAVMDSLAGKAGELREKVGLKIRSLDHQERTL